MKKLILFAALLAAYCTAPAQTTIKQDKQGNYYAVKDTAKVSKAINGTKTGKTFTDANGIKYDIWQGAKGGLFYWKQSKKGVNYKVYLTQKEGKK